MNLLDGGQVKIDDGDYSNLAFRGDRIMLLAFGLPPREVGVKHVFETPDPSISKQLECRHGTEYRHFPHPPKKDVALHINRHYILQI